MVHHEAVRQRSEMISDLWKLTLMQAWPVGQAVKTAASHAVNVGSIPARVTIFRKKSSENCFSHIVGVDDNEGPPVPIPNTEVKLVGAEDTWLAMARDNRKTPTQTFLNSSAGRACDC